MSAFTKPFTKPLIVRYVGEQNKKAIWEIQESFVYYIGSPNSEEYIEVPVGFITDFASIPKSLWNIFPPSGKYIKASVIHDYLTNNKGKVKIKEKERYFSKKEVDDIFYEAMGVLGVSYIVKKMVYFSVRLFGDSSGYKI